MLKHVLMFRLKEEADTGEKSENLAQLKKALEDLAGIIPEIKGLKTGINISPSPASYDLYYYTEFENITALERYRVHPEHQKVLKLVGELCADKVVVDYW